jgi:glutamine synthetase
VAGEATGLLTLEELAETVRKGDVDTVVVAFTDMQGRLMGKRLHAEHFLEDIVPGKSVEGCNYLLRGHLSARTGDHGESGTWSRRR